MNPENVINMNKQGAAEQGGPNVKAPPQMMKQATAFRGIINTILHSKENRGNVQHLLTGFKDNPEVGIPQAAEIINKQAVQMAGGNVPQDVQLGVAVSLVTDLAHLGQAMKLWPVLPANEVKAIFKDTVQDHIQKGLHDGTIEPEDLQRKAEPLLSPEQRQQGMDLAKKHGLREEADPRAIAAQAQKTAVNKAKMEMAKQNGGGM